MMDKSTQEAPKDSQEVTMQAVQTRVWSSLKSGYKYHGMADTSEKYLRSRVREKLDLTIMYVDLVGSTTMSLEISESKFVTIISSFAHEMAHAVIRHDGYVLKFVGDAVLAYFPNDPKSTASTYNAMNCAEEMINIVTKGMNPILNQYDYPDLKIKTGIDSGQVVAISYGMEEEDFPIDLIGPAMNIAAKIQSLAAPNQVLIGEDVYKNLNADMKKQFIVKTFSDGIWQYRSRMTGAIYNVYGHHPS